MASSADVNTMAILQVRIKYSYVNYIVLLRLSRSFCESLIAAMKNH